MSGTRRTRTNLASIQVMFIRKQIRFIVIAQVAGYCTIVSESHFYTNAINCWFPSSLTIKSSCISSVALQPSGMPVGFKNICLQISEIPDYRMRLTREYILDGNPMIKKSMHTRCVYYNPTRLLNAIRIVLIKIGTMLRYADCDNPVNGDGFPPLKEWAKKPSLQ